MPSLLAPILADEYNVTSLLAGVEVKAVEIPLVSASMVNLVWNAPS